VVLPQNGHPIIGKKKFQAISTNTGIKKTPPWKPFRVHISNAGDMAYTIGKYKISLKEGAKQTEPVHGYYCLIWRKGSRGKWKIVFCRGLLLGKITNKQPPHLNQERHLSPDEKDLIKTELRFSQHSQTHGTAAAFYNYIDDSGIALSSSGPPLKKDFYQQQMKKKPRVGWKAQLQWYPIFTTVSVSGDLGYNFGPYEYNISDPNGKSRAFYGYFLTIWKKQVDGSWKFVFDGGNQSPGPGGQF
jgi:ketosteroid isomerase-like protein